MKVNSEAGPVALCLPLTLALTFTDAAALCAGETTVHVVIEAQLIEPASLAPNWILVPDPRAKPVPVMVTDVPPATEPLFGLTSVIVGAARAKVRIGVSTAHESLAMVPAAYAEARRAAEGLGAGGGVLSLSEMSPVDYLASHADDVAPRLVPEAVQDFIREDLDRDGVLIETVLAYAEADMNLARTAERLHVHVNTARYRLSRVSERTGYGPRSLANMLDLVLAIRMLSADRARA